MNLKIWLKKKSIRTKLKSHIVKNGKLHLSEKTVIKSFKHIQKYQKKNHTKLIKLAILNITPTFRVIKLTNKKRRKKSIKEIPTFLSNYNSRAAWGLKYLVKASLLRTKSDKFFIKLKDELLKSTLETESSAIEQKNNIQNKALQEKKYFRHYRW